MTAKPYLLPEGNVQVAFSGGRSSAYMLHQIIAANGLDAMHDPRVQITFQNTGFEHEAALNFVAEVGWRWGVPITWLEYRPVPPFFEVIGHQGAARILAQIGERPQSAARFSKRFSKRSLRRLVEDQGDWILSDEAGLCQADDGECTG